MLTFFKKIFSIDKQKLLRFACENSQVKILKYLLKDENIDPAINKNELVQEAIREGSCKIVETLINDSRVNPNINLVENIKIATENKKYNTMRLIMSNERIDKNNNISDSIYVTLYCRDFKGFEILTLNNDFKKEGFESDIAIKIFFHGNENIAKSIINNKNIEFLSYAEKSLEYSLHYKYNRSAMLLLEKFHEEGKLTFNIAKYIFINGYTYFLPYLISLDLGEDFWDLAVKESIEENQIEMIKLLFKENKIKKDDAKNDKHIHYAIKHNYEKIFYFLLEYCNVNPAKEKESLLNATKNNNLNIIKTLLQNDDIDINMTDNSYHFYGYKRDTPLSVAVEESYHNITYYLLENNKIDVTLKDNFILDVASKNNNFEIFLFLINNFDFKLTNTNYNNAFKYAIIFNNVEVFELLLNESEFDHTEYINKNIETAVNEGSFDVLKLMLKSESCVFSEDLSLILKSVKCSNNEILPYLLKEKQINHSLDSNESLLAAIKLNDLTKVKLLISSNLLRFADDKNIIAAAVLKDSEILSYLLKETNINPNKSSYYSKEPIVIACNNDNEQSIRLLIEDSRVDPSINNNEALLNAIKIHSIDIITLLLNDNRVTPSNNPEILMEAINRKDLDIFKKIAAYDSVDFKGDSYDYYFKKPLYASISRGFLYAVDFLVNQKHINPSLNNNEHIIEANKKGEGEISELLFKDKRVFNTLKKNDEKLFNKLNKNRIRDNVVDF
jgi:hypothetical protein